MGLINSFLGVATRMILGKPIGQSEVSGLKVIVEGDAGKYYVRVSTDGTNPHHGAKGEIEIFGFRETPGSVFGWGDGVHYVSDNTPFSRFVLTEVPGTHELKLSTYVLRNNREAIENERNVMRPDDRIAKIRETHDAGLRESPSPTVWNNH